MIDLSNYDEIIIWGAAFSPSDLGGLSTSHGHSMDKLANLLKSKNSWNKVIAIVDSNKALHGKKRLGIEVHSPDFIKEHKHALIVINTISICSIQNSLLDLNANNDCAIIPYYFYHGTLDHPYNNEKARDVISRYGQRIKELYDLSDSITNRYLEIIFKLRECADDMLYDSCFYEGTGKGIAYFCDPALSPEGDITYIDVGAFDGDSLSPVDIFYGSRLKRYVGFEPDENSLKKLKEYVNEHEMADRCTLLPYALGDDDGEIRFSISGSTSQESEQGEIVLGKRKFDNIKGIEIVGDALVKMDIEGAELDALKGMKFFIKEYSPYLAICIYHREEDIFEIANYIKSLNDGYHLYIRGGWHLECWAVPERHFSRCLA